MVTDISRDELKQKLDHPRKSVLVEVLPSDDYHKLHLPGAISIPLDHLQGQALELLPNKDVEVIVYGAGPGFDASKRASDELTAMGYSNVRDYVGGKRDWLEAGFPVVRNGGPKATA